MTDRELLEAAAKAVGIGSYKGDYANGLDTKTGFWNPLTDDGDALRLAVKLGISVSQERRNGCVFCDANEGKVTADEEFGTDPYAATRRAIVRAAAEIGRAMK
jgi:hypothetical protein